MIALKVRGKLGVVWNQFLRSPANCDCVVTTADVGGVDRGKGPPSPLLINSIRSEITSLWSVMDLSPSTSPPFVLANPHSTQLSPRLPPWYVFQSNIKLYLVIAFATEKASVWVFYKAFFQTFDVALSYWYWWGWHRWMGSRFRLKMINLVRCMQGSSSSAAISFYQ